MTKKFRLAKGSLATFVAVTTVASALGGMTLLQAQSQTYTCPAPGGFTDPPVGVPPLGLPPVLTSLKTLLNPVIPKDIYGQPAIRADLVDYIANLNAAIQLGKTFFWEMQAGSDNTTACATCHFKAGADGRDTNELHPGPDGQWGPQLAANHAFTVNDFPLSFRGAPPEHDNVAGSQGVRKSTFGGIGRNGAEVITPVADPVFNVGGVNVRQVTGIQTPSVINAVFNHRNFWNGRAQPEFNGVNPFGNRDASARVWYVGPNGPTQIDIHIANASLASQAVGPAMNPVEMSAAGRTFPDLGHKLLGLKPLGRQQVDPTDSVLGSVAAATGGLTTSYASMIQAAFKPKWWNTTKALKIGGKSYTMTEANFSLFWGLSIMMYEATLVADDTPMDRYLAPAGIANPRIPLSNTTALNSIVSRLAAEGITVSVDDILTGLALFEMPPALPPSYPVPNVVSSGQLGILQAMSQGGAGLGCFGCHIGAELTAASINNLTLGNEAGHPALKIAGFDLRMEREFMKLDWPTLGPISPAPTGSDAITFDPASYAVHVTSIAGLAPPNGPIPLPVKTYDTGWYNLGVRPTADNPGLDGTDPFGSYLSWTRSYQASATPGIVKVIGATLGCQGMNLNTGFPNEVLNQSGFPLLSGPLAKTEPTDTAGSFKVPSLRNVELTGPYFHNGGKATLGQVVEFYDDGGDFDSGDKFPSILPLQLAAPGQPDRRRALVAFLLSLTDERVRVQQAPFDHPSLTVPNGDSTPGTDNMMSIPAVGRYGNALLPLRRFLSNLDPFYPIP